MAAPALHDTAAYEAHRNNGVAAQLSWFVFPDGRRVSIHGTIPEFEHFLGQQNTQIKPQALGEVWCVILVTRVC